MIQAANSLSFMPTRSARTQASAQFDRSGHESSDAHAGWIFGSILFLGMLVIAIQFFMGGMLKFLERKPPTADQYRAKSRGPAWAAPASFPRLQTVPAADLIIFRDKEEKELHSYGWVDKGAGVVRIPIEQAMDLLLQRGLPVRNGTNAGKTGPSSYQLEQQRGIRRGNEAPGNQ